METIPYRAASSALADIMERVVNNHEPVIITHGQGKAVVILSLEDYKSMEETAALLRSPKNAQRLLESISQLESGRGKAQDLDE